MDRSLWRFSSTISFSVQTPPLLGLNSDDLRQWAVEPAIIGSNGSREAFEAKWARLSALRECRSADLPPAIGRRSRLPMARIVVQPSPRSSFAGTAPRTPCTPSRPTAPHQPGQRRGQLEHSARRGARAPVSRANFCWPVPHRRHRAPTPHQRSPASAGHLGRSAGASRCTHKGGTFHPAKSEDLEPPLPSPGSWSAEGRDASSASGGRPQGNTIGTRRPPQATQRSGDCVPSCIATAQQDGTACDPARYSAGPTSSSEVIHNTNPPPIYRHRAGSIVTF